MYIGHTDLHVACVCHVLSMGYNTCSSHARVKTHSRDPEAKLSQQLHWHSMPRKTVNWPSPNIS